MASNRFGRRLMAGALWTGLGLALVSTGGCASAGKALGMGKATPDEFRVVTKAPLVVPPDYALRPPSPGEPRPQELQPESQARAALLGQGAGANRTQGETLLAAKAGADRADPLIRYVVDDEFGDVAHKDKSFVDKILGRGGSTPAAAGTAAAPQVRVEPGATESKPLNPATEESRVADLTGGKTIVISRGRGGASKLPGL